VQLDQVSEGHHHHRELWPSAGLIGSVALIGSAGWLVKVRRSRQG
jgi:nickel transport protein